MLWLALAAAFPAQAEQLVESAQSAQTADLAELSLEQLLDIPIVGASKYEQTQREVAAAVSVITRDEIQAFGWRTLDEALASLPGIHVSYDRQYAYGGTRGFGLPGDYNTRLLVTINGSRVNDPIYDSGPLGRNLPIDLDLLERIEFIPGPGGAVYGQNAMFGVVNLVTRSGAAVDGAELTAAYQPRQSQREGRASWGKRLANGVDVLVSVSGLRADGEDRFFDYGAAGVSGVAVGLDSDRDQEVFARVARGPWSFELVHGDRRKDDPTGTFFSDPLVPGQSQADRYQLAQLQYQDSFAGDTLQLSARLFNGRHRYDSVLSYGGPMEFPAAGDWRGAELRLLSTAWAGHKLLLGAEVQENVRQDQFSKDRSDPANDLAILRSGYRVGLYGQDEWRITGTLMATLGVRLDRNNVTGTDVSPRLALIWQATPATTIKTLYGRAYRAPNAYERDYADGLAQVANTALSGESIETLELVADHRVGRELTLRGSIYQWRLHDLVTLGIDPASGLPQYQSGEEVTARGLELSADQAWASNVRLRGSVSLQDVAYAGGADLLNSPELLAKLNLSAPLPVAGLRAGYELRYDGPRLSLDGTLLGGYALSNLNLGTQALAEGLELSLGIYNLFDKRYQHPGSETNWQNALEQDGRSLRFRLGYRF
ncbi:TonB-dependent receptor plug domain-containing protein [Lysobacter koreensis]|uniref:TonB-dependent receptor plug domain-containing protein n=2 Tax=Lysobacter koreensis TaxID=266122 RepID=A0ABW2YJD7_9GAMM